MDLTVLSFENHGLVRIIRLTSTSLPVHQAGHYAMLQFGEHPARPYSIANSPNGEYLEFHIKNGGHAGGSTHATTELKIGEIVKFHGFGGNYTSIDDCSRPLILIAGGTGLAPMLSIAEARRKANPARPVTLYHGGRHMSDLYYLEHLNAQMPKTIGFKYIPALSEEQNDGVLFGVIGDIALSNPDILNARIYIAGPVDMVTSTVDKALAKGVPPDVIHSDLAAMLKTK